MNIRLVATEVGDLLKYDTTLNEIDRYGRALFRFERDTFPNPAITSVRAQRIYDWILTLARQEMRPGERTALLRTFCQKVAGAKKETRARIDVILREGGFDVPLGDSDGESAATSKVPGVRKTQSQQITLQLRLLLRMFDVLCSAQDHQRRGLLLQDLLNQAFLIYQVPVVRSFTRNQGGEQIDGAFKLDGWHYLVECRWRTEPANGRDLDGLLGQVARSGKQTMGLFLSINGWSTNVVGLLQQNPDKSVLLMDGVDLRSTLDRSCPLPELILAKAQKLAIAAEPFYGASSYVRDRLQTPEREDPT